MDTPQKLIVCCVAFALCLSIPLSGCGGAFSNKYAAVLDRNEIADGSVVELVHEWESNSLDGSSAGTLTVRHVADEVVRCYTIELEDPRREDYSLRVDAENRRACVVDDRSKRIMLSLDFADEKVRRYPVDHPE